MKRSRFTEEQIIAVFREHEAGLDDGRSGPQARDLSDATLYNWKAKCGGMDVSYAKRLKARGGECQAEESCLPTRCWKPLHCASCCPKMVRPAARREAVAHLQAAMGLSEQRAS